MEDATVTLSTVISIISVLSAISAIIVAWIGVSRNSGKDTSLINARLATLEANSNSSNRRLDEILSMIKEVERDTKANSELAAKSEQRWDSFMNQHEELVRRVEKLESRS